MSTVQPPMQLKCDGPKCKASFLGENEIIPNPDLPAGHPDERWQYKTARMDPTEAETYLESEAVDMGWIEVNFGGQSWVHFHSTKCLKRYCREVVKN